MESARGLSIRIIAFAAFSALCYFGAAVIITMLLAVFLAYMLEPLVSMLERIRFPRSIAIMVMMLLTGVVFAGMLLLFVERAQSFSNNLPRYAKRIQKISADVRGRLRTLEKKSEDISITILPPTKKEPEPVRMQQYSTWRDFLFRDLVRFTRLYCS